MGKLERARIHVLKNDNGKQTDEVQSAIEVCFNPKEYSLEKSVEWDGENAFSDAPQPEFKAPKPMTLSVTLQFDTYEERVSVRDKWVRQLERLAMMTGKVKKEKKPTPQEKKALRPPVILFVWGRFTFKGVVESLSQKYTMFLSDGTPVRAECALKIRNVIDEAGDKDGKDATFSKEAKTKTVNVGPNDRLDLIAARELGDAGRWAEIAAMNDIVDPGRITDGNDERVTKLDMPED
jgi:hypothetical protein